MSDTSNDSGEVRYWAQTIDGTLYACWYRLRPDGQIEVFARGHHVVLPVDAIALLPESVARAVLGQLVCTGAASEHGDLAHPQLGFNLAPAEIPAALNCQPGESAASPPTASKHT